MPPLSPHSATDAIGSIGWTERTGGVLTARERLTLRPAAAARPARAIHRRPSRDGAPTALRGAGAPSTQRALVPRRTPSLAREAEAAAHDLLTPVLLNHSQSCLRLGRGHRRTARRSTFDRELLYRGRDVPRHRPARARCPMSTSRFAAPRWHASSPTATTCLPINASLLPTRSPCTTRPGLAWNPVPRPTSSCLRSRRCVRPRQQRDTRRGPRKRHPAVPAVGLQAGVRRPSPSRGQASPSRPRLVPAPLRHKRPEHSARAVP